MRETENERELKNKARKRFVQPEVRFRNRGSWEEERGKRTNQMVDSRAPTNCITQRVYIIQFREQK